jgi:flagellar biogenesis protein FliO
MFLVGFLGWAIYRIQQGQAGGGAASRRLPTVDSLPVGGGLSPVPVP